MWEELSVYDLYSIANVIICAGRNEYPRRLKVKTFEALYDQLVVLIKSANKNSTIDLSKITPQGTQI